MLSLTVTYKSKKAMKKLLLTTVAVAALCAAMAPAYADRICERSADGSTAWCHDGPSPAHDIDTTSYTFQNWGVSDAEFHCVAKLVTPDMLYHQMMAINGHPGSNKKSDDPIAECNIPRERIGGAMRVIMEYYLSNGGGPSSWVESYCKPQLAYPINKLVCNYNGVTWQ